jgi:hypothetical protein
MTEEKIRPRETASNAFIQKLTTRREQNLVSGLAAHVLVKNDFVIDKDFVLPGFDNDQLISTDVHAEDQRVLAGIDDVNGAVTGWLPGQTVLPLSDDDRIGRPCGSAPRGRTGTGINSASWTAAAASAGDKEKLVSCFAADVLVEHDAVVQKNFVLPGLYDDELISADIHSVNFAILSGVHDPDFSISSGLPRQAVLTLGDNDCIARPRAATNHRRGATTLRRWERAGITIAATTGRRPGRWSGGRSGRRATRPAAGATPAIRGKQNLKPRFAAQVFVRDDPAIEENPISSRFDRGGLSAMHLNRKDHAIDPRIDEIDDANAVGCP